MTVRIAALVIPAALVVLACGSPPATEQEAPGAAPVAAPAAAPTAPPELAVAPQHEPAGDVEFLAAFDLHQKKSETEPKLRHGQVADSKEWPASLYATFTTPSGTAACTAALIGPQVMLTAAHCVPSNGAVRFTYQLKTYSTSCTRHPEYVSRQDPSADYALCKLDRPFVEPTGFLYETVNTSSMNALLNKSITLTGFGCIGDAVRNSPADGKYRIGSNRIDETSASTRRLRPPQYYSPREDNNLFTIDDPALANLCPGDSGGPAFILSGQLTSRVIVGVNSRVFYRDQSMTTYGSSLISATGGPDFRNWAQGWTRNAGVAACGLAGALTKCRS